MENIDLTNEQTVIDLMLSSKSEDEWNNNCNAVKDANGGYPNWWYKEIVLGGVKDKAIISVVLIVLTGNVRHNQSSLI